MMLGLLVADLVDHLGLGDPDRVAERAVRLRAPSKADGRQTPEYLAKRRARYAANADRINAARREQARQEREGAGR
jgi:hypothetical protein